MVLKPQDVYVVLKIASGNSERPPFAQLARELSMSSSEVHASVQRAEACHLLHGPTLKNRPNFAALEEFLVHGLKYVFPAERGSMTRGVPTSYAAEPLRSLVAQGSEPVPVWPSAEGTQRGIAFEPLHKGAPRAALQDPTFHRYLAITDALRDGRVRERKIAQTELRRLVQQQG
jgi:DNA-binding Lrp family transcriptional regulator